MINDKNFKIINGNSLEVLDTLPENSINAIVTDPPYGLTSITKRFGKEGSAPNKYGTDKTVEDNKEEQLNLFDFVEDGGEEN